MRYKTCVKCKDYDKKRNKLQTKQAEAALRGLRYCNECEKAKPKDKFVMPNGNSYDQCRSCLFYGSDEDDRSSSYSYQCVHLLQVMYLSLLPSSVISRYILIYSIL